MCIRDSLITWNNPVGIGEEYKNLDSLYINKNMSVSYTHLDVYKRQVNTDCMVQHNEKQMCIRDRLVTD